jgi:colanic acid/amylovoran biosynthesis glycosyltransferase
MRLVLVVTTFPKLSETFIVSKFRGLLERGWDVHIVCSESKDLYWDYFSEVKNCASAGRRVHKVWPHRPRWIGLLLIPVALLRCLALSYKETCRYLKFGWPRYGLDTLRRLYLDAEFIILKPDILHFEFGVLAVGRVYLRDLLNCKVVVSFRGYDLNYMGLNKPKYYQEIWDKSDALHLLGEDLWKRAIKRGCSSAKLHVLIPPAVNTDFFASLEEKALEIAGTSDRPLQILTVSRLEWKKGLEYGLQAIRLLEDEGIHYRYHIIGDGDYLEAIAFARYQLRLNDVVFLGSQSPEEVKLQMEWADILLHPAVSEGFCNAVLEAQSMGVPVVCTDADGLAQNVADEQSGFVVPRRDPRVLCDKIIVLALDPQLRMRMGQAGRKRVTEKFGSDQQISLFSDFYDSLIDL